MHSGIRPSGAVHRPSLPVAESRQRGFELSLDRSGARLELEAREFRAVIFDRCAVTHRRALSSAY
jgi:hypothetical protein